MKKILTLVIGALALVMTACGGGDDPNAQKHNMTGNIVFDFARITVYATDLAKGVTCSMIISSESITGTFTEKDFYGSEGNSICYEEWEETYPIRKANFTIKETAKDKYLIEGWIECTDDIRHNVTINATREYLE